MLDGRSRPWSICVIAAVLAVVGAAEATSRPPVRTLYEMRTDNVILQEWDLSCGAAALATILNFQHGDAVSERQVALGLMGRPEYVAGW